ncbi:hypothetical protein DF215_21520 [Pectobacterium versatile]|nr:RHS repeat-associated core domain-containing protein [Pectobacterium versatile]PWD65359.1 hypothetical protein DF215_21520 [Pectobacterium versatile]
MFSCSSRTARELCSEEGEVRWRGEQGLWGAHREERRPIPLRRYLGDAANEEVYCELRYQGQLYDAETGLYYNRHRYYDAESGQYLSPDPIGLGGGIRPQSYVTNPLEFCDPLGLARSVCQARYERYKDYRSQGYSAEEAAKLSKGANPAMITPGSLPAAEEAAVNRTLGHIDNGDKPAGALGKKWGTTFKNHQGELPGGSGANSPYSEYRVDPGPGVSGAGARRVVVNNNTGETYYTWTHYGDSGNPSFVRIR